MPGTHSPISRDLFTLDGLVLTSGGAKNLSKGQFTIVNSAKAGANGAVVVTNFAGEPDSTVYEMRLGKSKIPATRTAYNSKPYSSHLFKIKDIVSIKANYPKVTKQTFDELIIGYDGINADTAITLEDNMTVPFDLVLWGDHLMYKTGEKQHLIKIHFGKEEGETNQSMVRRAVKVLKEQSLAGGIPVDELVEVSIVDSSNPALSGTAYVVSTLTITDNGDSNALAKVQAQYPAYPVVLQERSGLVSVYAILHPQASALAAYSSVESLAYIKDCADCTAGYTELAGGFVYSVTLEDDGVDQTALVDDLPGFVTGSVLRHGNKDGRGLYTVVTDDALTQAEIAAYVATAGIKTTATIELLGEVKDVCSDVNTSTVSWVDGDVCYAQTQQYTIQLKDNECGESRLAELQAAYPNNTIVVAPSTNSTRALTLTGTSGTANVTVAGVQYLATFDTNLTTTAANFVTTHGAAIKTATGATVTSDGAIITFTDATAGFPAISIANATTNLAGTLGAVTAVPSTGGCQTVYSTTVITNVVCDECSDIFLEQFTSEAPEDYDFTSWEPVPVADNANALMGIRIKGKPFIFYPDSNTRDYVPFYETSTRISVSAGYVEDENESFEPFNRDIFSVKRVSRAQDRENLGGNLMQWEDVSRAYFSGVERHKDNLFAQAVFQEESVLKYSSQYVSYDVTIHDSKYSQSAGGRSDIGITYKLWAEIGYHSALQNYVNKLAGRAGLAATEPLVLIP